MLRKLLDEASAVGVSPGMCLEVHVRDDEHFMHDIPVPIAEFAKTWEHVPGAHAVRRAAETMPQKAFLGVVHETGVVVAPLDRVGTVNT